MNERIAKLAEGPKRHEALTQSVEIPTIDSSELQGLVSQLTEGTERFLHVAEIQERRITRLEVTEFLVMRPSAEFNGDLLRQIFIELNFH